MRKPIVPIAAVATGVCVALSAGSAIASDAPSGTTSPTAPEDGIDVQVPDSTERLGEYWTRDRMRAAKPMPTPRIRREPVKPAAGSEDAEPE